MTKSDTIHIRIDPVMKKATERILSKMGLTVTEAINIYFNQICLKKALPFELNIHQYNDDTISALNEAMKICEDTTPYNNFDEILQEIDEEILQEKNNGI